MEGMKKMFTDVLEKNEEIVAVYKPNKKKFWWSWMLLTFTTVFWVWVFPFTVGIFDQNEFIGFGDRFWITLYATAGFFVLYMLIAAWLGSLWLKNRFYAYTNKRILIRAGIIGVDYKSLEFKSLTATVVKVSMLDKMVRRNTGTIRFGSPASPLTSFNSMQLNQYAYLHIEKPYEVMREIKEYIDSKEDK